MIRVLIADDHALVRQSLRLLLSREDDVECVADATSVAEARRLAGSLEPDVILLDLVMPGGRGIQVVPAILEAVPDARIAVLSMQDDPGYVSEAFAAGARGYVLKQAADEDLVTAVREVAAGRRYVHPSLRARVEAAEKAEHLLMQSTPVQGTS